MSSAAASSTITATSKGIKAIVVGSTGLIGKNLVRLLSQQSPQVYSKVVAISRRKDNPFESSSANPVPIEHISLDSLDDLNTIEDVFNGVSEAYCCLGTTIKRVGGDKTKFRHVDFDYPDSFASMVYKKFSETSAQQNSTDDEQVKQFFLVTAVGADSDSMFFYNQVKGDVEKSIAKKQLDFQTFTKTSTSPQSSFCHIIKPGLLIGERFDDERFGEKMAQGLNNLFSWALPKSVSGIQGSDVAKAMIQIAETSRKEKLDLLKERDAFNSVGGVDKETRFTNRVFAHGNAILKDYAEDYSKQHEE